MTVLSEDWDLVSCYSSDDELSPNVVVHVFDQKKHRHEKRKDHAVRVRDRVHRLEEETERWKLVTCVLVALQASQLLPGALNTLRRVPWGSFPLGRLLRLAISFIIFRFLVLAVQRASGLLRIRRRVAATATTSSSSPSAPLPAPPCATRSAPAPLPSTLEGEQLPPQVHRVLEVNMMNGWVTEKELPSLKWETRAVDWNGGHKVTRFTAEVKCSMEVFVEHIITTAPAGQRKYDNLLNEYRVLEARGDSEKILYMSFHSPVFMVAPRDLVTHVARALLSPQESVEFQLSPTPVGNPERFSRNAFDKMEYTLALGTWSTTHPAANTSSSHVRGKLNIQGYLVVPLGPARIRLIEIVGLDPCGQLSAYVVELGAKRIFEKFQSLVKFLEAEQKKK
eukprot:Sspe_Gene.41703::Locus_20182_Transcript_1_1_Confidence_1.000_Length_3907::g.41703::m.41703